MSNSRIVQIVSSRAGRALLVKRGAKRARAVRSEYLSVCGLEFGIVHVRTGQSMAIRIGNACEFFFCVRVPSYRKRVGRNSLCVGRNSPSPGRAGPGNTPGPGRLIWARFGPVWPGVVYTAPSECLTRRLISRNDMLLTRAIYSHTITQVAHWQKNRACGAPVVSVEGTSLKKIAPAARFSSCKLPTH